MNRRIKVSEETVHCALNALHRTATLYDSGPTPEVRALSTRYRDAFDALADAWTVGR